MVTRCSDCGVEASPTKTPRCLQCKTLMSLPPDASHFEVLGVPQGFSLTPADLDAAFRQRSLQVHPDRFAGASDKERRTAVERSAALTTAHRVLKHPESRALYLLKLANVGLPQTADPELLTELMEARETAESSPEAKAAVLDRATTERGTLYARLADGFAQLEQDEALLDAARMKPLADLVMRIRYLTRLCEDLQGVRDETPVAMH
jgi:molecular chaperone HscB